MCECKAIRLSVLIPFYCQCVNRCVSLKNETFLHFLGSLRSPCWLISVQKTTQYLWENPKECDLYDFFLAFLPWKNRKGTDFNVVPHPTLKRGRSHLGFVDLMTCTAAQIHLTHCWLWWKSKTISRCAAQPTCYIDMYFALSRSPSCILLQCLILILSPLKTWSHTRDMLRRAVVRS